jgi:hypothetical protein
MHFDCGGFMSEKQACCEKIWRGFGFDPKPCGRTAKVERDGKPFCGMHDPVARKKKQAARDAVFYKNMKEKARVNRIRHAAPDLLEALQALYGAVDSCVELTPAVMQKARAAIAKATGEQP